MLNVVIADDEYLVRVMLKNCLDWNQLGCSIIGEVAAGDQIVPTCEKLHPDLLILDINMPIVSGIEALEQLRAHGLTTYVIIISGYSDFEYAKKGIRFDAFDYLLKPVDVKELQGCIIKAVKQIESRKATDQSALPAHYNHNDFLTFLEQPELFIHQPQEPDIKLPQACCHCIIIEIDHFYEVLKSNDSIDKVKARIHSDLIEALTGQAFIFYNEWNRITVFLLTKSSPIHQLQNFSSTLQHDFSVTIGLSRQGSIYHPKKLTREAEIAIRLKPLSSDSRIFVFQDELPDQKTEPLTLFPRQQLLNSFKADCGQAAGDILTEYYHSLDPACSFQLIKALSHDAFIQIFYYLQNQGLEPEPELLHNSFHSFSGIETITALEIWMQKRLKILKEHCQNQGNTSDTIIADTLKYLHRHMFDSELSLERAAAALHVNASYLSHIFKKQQQIGINSFIQKERMAYALNLINNTPLKMTEIATMCGYKDASYFGKCVKNHFGLSFSQLRSFGLTEHREGHDA